MILSSKIVFYTVEAHIRIEETYSIVVPPLLDMKCKVFAAKIHIKQHSLGSLLSTIISF